MVPRQASVALASIEADGSALWSCVGSVNIDREARVLWWADPLHTRDLSDALLTNNSIPGGGSGVWSPPVSRAPSAASTTRCRILPTGTSISAWLSDPPLRPSTPPSSATLCTPAAWPHDIRRSMAEYRYMGIKYARSALRARRAAGRRAMADLLDWNGLQRRSPAHRCATVPAARTTTRPPSIVAFDGMALVPTSVYRARVHRGAAQVPADLAESAADWLHPYTPPESLAAPSCVTRPMSRDALAARVRQPQARSHRRPVQEGLTVFPRRAAPKADGDDSNPGRSSPAAPDFWAAICAKPC